MEGFGAVELIITIVFVAFALLGIYSFFQPASILSANFSNHIIALHLGREGMEVVKNIRDNNIRAGRPWSQGLNACQSGCQLDYKTGTPVETPSDALQSYDSSKFLQVNSDGFYDYNGTSSLYKRKVTITPVQPPVGGGIIVPPIIGGDSDVLKVEVLVTWSYNARSFNFQTIGYLFKY